MVTIQVFYRYDGKPAANKKVTVHTRGMLDAWTDHNGNADVDIKPGRGKVWVGNELVYEGEIEGRLSVYMKP